MVVVHRCSVDNLASRSWPTDMGGTRSTPVYCAAGTLWTTGVGQLGGVNYAIDYGYGGILGALSGMDYGYGAELQASAVRGLTTDVGLDVRQWSEETRQIKLPFYPIAVICLVRMPRIARVVSRHSGGLELNGAGCFRRCSPHGVKRLKAPGNALECFHARKHSSADGLQRAPWLAGLLDGGRRLPLPQPLARRTRKPTTFLSSGNHYVSVPQRAATGLPHHDVHVAPQSVQALDHLGLANAAEFAAQ